MMRHRLIAIFLSLGLAGCAELLPHGQQTEVAPPPPRSLASYILGPADKIRLIVYNEPGLSAEYTVNSNGELDIPLIGDIRADGRTAAQIRDDMQARFAAGYLRHPQVSIEVLVFRPFYILGEVQKPGEYPYSDGMTVLKAVATAQGFTYRADTHHVYLKTPKDSIEHKYNLTEIGIQPGDTIRIGQRYF